MKKIEPPLNDEYALYYDTYVALVDQNISVLDQLKSNAVQFKNLIKSLSDEQMAYKYAPGKWSIKDILMHLIDSERVFTYRAMRFSRLDKTPLPFFDENEFAQRAAASKISTAKLIKEYVAQRNATIAFFNNLTLRQLKSTGIAGNTSTSARACLWMIAGHELHHWGVIKEKYLGVK